MITANVLYNTTTGRILSAGLISPSPVPVGHAVTAKSIAALTDLFNKRIDPGTLQIVDKNYLKLDSATTVGIGTVSAELFSKHDGTLKTLMGSPGDNEAVQVSARQPDFSFNAAFRRAFFDILQTALVSGVGQVKLAAGLAPGNEILVVFNDTLTPIFKQLTYA